MMGFSNNKFSANFGKQSFIKVNVISNTSFMKTAIMKDLSFTASALGVP